MLKKIIKRFRLKIRKKKKEKIQKLTLLARF